MSMMNKWIQYEQIDEYSKKSDFYNKIFFTI